MRARNKNQTLPERREYFEVQCTSLEKAELKYRAAEHGETISEYVLYRCFGPNGVCGAGGGRYDEELISKLKGFTVEAKKERRKEQLKAAAQARKLKRQKKKAAKNRKIERMKQQQNTGKLKLK